MSTPRFIPDYKPPTSHLNPRTFVIEVVDMDSVMWTACANDREGILKELKSAPPAAAITIYEWMLAKPINQKGHLWWMRYPVWKLMETRPWALERPEDD